MTPCGPPVLACAVGHEQPGGSAAPTPQPRTDPRGTRPRVALLAVLLLALLVRIAVLFTVGETSVLRGDEDYYVGNARALATSGTYRGAFRPPGQSALIAAAFVVAGESLRAVRLLQILVSLITVALVFDLARRAYGLRAGVAAGVACAIHPTLVSYTHFIWSETLYGAALAGAVWSLDRFTDRGLARAAVGGGLALGVAALTRETALYFVPVAAGWMALRGTLPARARVRGVVALVVTVSVLVVPWLVRNERRFGTAAISTNRWRVIAYGNASDAVLGEMKDEMRARHAVRTVEREEIARATALRAIREQQPTWIFRKAAHATVQLLAGRSQLSRFVKKRWLPPDRLAIGRWLVRVESVVGAITIALSLAGLWLTRPSSLKSLVLLLLGFHWAIYAVSFTNPRFVVPLLPLATIYGGALVGGVIREEAPSARRVLGAALSLGLYALILAYRLGDAS